MTLDTYEELILHHQIQRCLEGIALWDFRLKKSSVHAVVKYIFCYLKCLKTEVCVCISDGAWIKTNTWSSMYDLPFRHR